MVSTKLDKAEVVVIGGGVSGLSSAWWLAQQGADVVVLEKGVVGWEASGRNGGGLGHRAHDPPVTPLATKALQLWPEMHERLGYPTEHIQGRCRVALTERQMESCVAGHEMCLKAGVPSYLMDPQEIKELVPVVNPDVVGGVMAPTEGKTNPQRVVQAYAWAIQDHGGRIYQHTTATGFQMSGGKVTVVETNRGEIECDFVVSAAGPQTGLLAEMVGAFVPVSPARVEIIVTAPIPRHWAGGFVGNGLYGRQTVRGNLAYGGGPHEWIDVDNTTPRKPNTPLIRNIARRLAEFLSGAAEVPVIRSWSGVVEQTPDMWPIIDFLPDPSNFLVVTVSGHGYGLSPSTGFVVSEMVLKGESSINIDGLSYSRFADVPMEWNRERGWVPLPEGSDYRDYPYSHYEGVGGLPQEVLQGFAAGSSEAVSGESGDRYVC